MAQPVSAISDLCPYVNTANVAIVGAGFSYAATYGDAPVMGTFFDRLTETTSPSLWSFLSRAEQSPQDANVENVLLTLAQICSSPQEAVCGWGDQWSSCERLIRQELGDYTLERLRRLPYYGVSNLASACLLNLRKSTTVISFNYDNVAETALTKRRCLSHLYETDWPTCSHCKMRRLLQLSCDCTGKNPYEDPRLWRGAILKLHGSATWKHCLNRDCCNNHCITASDDCSAFQPCNCELCDDVCAPVMVMPSMSKDLNQFPEISVMWRCAHHAIKESEQILIYGFSFPESDALFSEMMRDALSQRKRLRRITIIDPCAESVESRLRKVVPPSIDVEVVLLSPPKVNRRRLAVQSVT